MQVTDVFQSARILGENILNSEIYKAVQESEQTVMADEEAMTLISAAAEKQNTLDEAVSVGDAEAIAKAETELEEAKNAMNAHPLVARMRSCREEYNRMMTTVNQIITFVVTGEMEGVEGGEGGCTGNCASCGGCGN